MPFWDDQNMTQGDGETVVNGNSIFVGHDDSTINNIAKGARLRVVYSGSTLHSGVKHVISRKFTNLAL